MSKKEDVEILSWYKKGWKDELHGTTTTSSEKDILNNAYSLGALHCLLGDDNRSFDYLSEEEILKTIKQ